MTDFDLLERQINRLGMTVTLHETHCWDVDVTGMMPMIHLWKTYIDKRGEAVPWAHIMQQANLMWRVLHNEPIKQTERMW